MWKGLRVALCWMVFLLIMATAVKAAINFLVIEKPGDPPPSSSSAEARRNRIWVCDYSVVPNVFRLDGRVLHLGEAWVEEAIEDGHLVWFRKRLGWNRLCFTIPRRNDGALSLDHFGTAFTKYAGADFIYVTKLEHGELPVLECNVEFWLWEPKKESTLGKIVLSPTK